LLMRNLMAAIGGALVVTFLWYILNLWMNNAGIAFIREHGWPASTVWLALAAGAVLGVVRNSCRRRADLRRTAAAVLTAADLGLAYTPTVERPSASLPCFENWYSGKDGYTGEIGGEPVSVFDMTEYIRSDDGSCYQSRTIVLLSAAGLPEATACPRWFRGWFAHAFGFGGTTFDPAAAPAGQANTVRRFGRAMRIELPGDPGPWKAETTETRAQDAAVRRIFAPGLMAALLDHRGWSFQTSGGWLACWRGKAVRPRSERPALIAAAKEIRAALLAAVADPTPVVLPPLSLPTPGQYIARMLGTLAGAILGLFATFFGSTSAAADLTLFSFVPFLAMVGGGITGGLFGYWTGAVFGRLSLIARWRPPAEDTPEHRAEKRRRGRWQIGFGCVGWFVGLAAGLTIFITLKEFVWGGNGGWKALLPVIFFGGGVTGLFSGVVIGNQVARRRADRPPNSAKPSV
jgi:hypothetical protein